jgi:glucose/arabinose dehydrogenase
VTRRRSSAIAMSIAIAVGLALAAPSLPARAAVSASSSFTAAAAPTLTDTVIQSGLSIPWDLAFAPDGRMFVTIRSGQIRIYASGAAGAALLSTTPVTVHTSTEAGLMGIALDPAFASNGLVYVCASRDDSGWKNQVLRYRASGNTLTPDANFYVIRNGMAANHTHDGCRIRFGPDGKLWVTMGDADDSTASQNPNSLNGKVLRINSDGTVPSDNPILPGASARTAAYTMGHRNPQGITFEPGTGRVFAVEHGAGTHDEINVLAAGANYGWPTYEGPVGQPGFTDPLWSSGGVTLATSGATFVNNTAWESWDGSLFVATLKEADLRRFTVSGNSVTAAETLLDNKYGRLRTAVQGPDGALYITTSNGPDDKIVRLVASAAPPPPPPPPPGSQTVTFDDRAGQNQALSGQYPTGVIDWGTSGWYHSAPWGQFTTKSVSFRAAGMTVASFTFVTPRRFLSVRAYNGGGGATTVAISCAGQATKTQSVAAGQLVTILTGWTGDCATVTVSSSNGWDTNFDDLVHDSAGGGTDTTPPVIGGITATAITSSGATIQWTTNEPADGQVEYGTTTAYGTSTPVNSALVTSHSQQLTALTPSTLYHYRVKSKDAAGNPAVSGNATFTTAAAVRATVTFDDRAGQNQPLNGAYPSGVIEWGTGQWWHSAPWKAFTTKSVSFSSAGITNATFFFVSPRKVVSIRAFNGGPSAATVTLSCAQQATLQTPIAAGQIVTITTGWTGACASVDIATTNSWDTNFDDLVHDPP